MYFGSACFSCFLKLCHSEALASKNWPFSRKRSKDLRDLAVMSSCSRSLMEAGAWPRSALCGITRILNWILNLMGYKWREIKIGITQELLEDLVKKLSSSIVQHLEAMQGCFAESSEEEVTIIRNNFHLILRQSVWLLECFSVELNA